MVVAGIMLPLFALFLEGEVCEKGNITVHRACQAITTNKYLLSSTCPNLLSEQ